MAGEPKPKGGLEDVVATSSAICYLDGDRGVLAYCGYDVHDLAREVTFEEVCFLLWHRRLPTRAELGDLQSQLEGTENRISVERRRYNETAREYNTFIRLFPQAIVATLRNFRERSYFQADADAKTAPKVQF